MNDTNIKHGYSLMVRDGDARGTSYLESRDANFKSRGRFYATRGAILKSGAQYNLYKEPQGLDFLTMLALGVGPGTCQVMHSGLKHAQFYSDLCESGVIVPCI